MEPREISVSRLFDHTMSSKATCARTELALAGSHACAQGRTEMCVHCCVLLWGGGVAAIRPKCQTESVCSGEK